MGMVRLNIGAGDHKVPGYVAIDKYDRAADILADVCHLPCRDESIDEILMMQVIEHVPYHLEAQMFKELRRVLRPGGTLLTECPDIEYIAADIVASGDITENWIFNIFGQTYRPWDQRRYSDWFDNANSRHQNAFTIAKCKRLGARFGFGIHENSRKLSDYPECLSLTWTKVG
jgi:predicted SAM-dependent methyltransferase